MSEQSHNPAPRAPAPDPYIPFGIHAGKHASEVDVKYLDWLMGEGWCGKTLRDQLLAHLKTRAEWQRM